MWQKEKLQAQKQRLSKQEDLPAGVPWRSPLVSFLYAYDTVIWRLHRYWPFIALKKTEQEETQILNKLNMKKTAISTSITTMVGRY